MNKTIRDDIHNFESISEQTESGFGRDEVSDILSGNDSLDVKALRLDLFASKRHLDFSLELSNLFNEKQLVSLLLHNLYQIHQIIPQSTLDLQPEKMADILCKAIELRLHNAMKLLVEAGVMLNVAGQYGMLPIHHAAKSGDVEAMEYLLSNGADLNVADLGGRLPMHFAAESGKVEAMEFLLNKGAYLNVKDKYFDMLPIHFAAQSGKVEAMEFLLNKGAYLNVKDKYFDRLPMHFAAASVKVEAIEFLFDKGAEVNVADKDGRLPIHFAAKSGEVEAIEYLLSKDANINVADTSGMLPIHYASEWGQVEAIAYLLSNGADVNVADKDGMLPIEYAAESGEVKSIEYLLPLTTAEVPQDLQDEISTILQKPYAQAREDLVAKLKIAKDLESKAGRAKELDASSDKDLKLESSSASAVASSDCEEKASDDDDSPERAFDPVKEEGEVASPLSTYAATISGWDLERLEAELVVESQEYTNSQSADRREEALQWIMAIEARLYDIHESSHIIGGASAAAGFGLGE